MTGVIARAVHEVSNDVWIVAQVSAAGALWDLGIHPIGVFGAQRKADGTPEDAAEEGAYW